MNKQQKVTFIVCASSLLALGWLAMFIAGSKENTINSWWGVGLAVVTIIYGILGLLTAGHWSWLKSYVGKGIFFISLGLIMWGVGQAGWMYYVFKDPLTQSPPSHLLDILYFSSIPLWTVGIYMLSKATGAKYALRKTKGKLMVLILSVVMIIFSYYFLVVVARGGSAYFEQAFWKKFFDLGYSMGDAINFTLALSIFGLSFKRLGGKFKQPIISILVAFGLLFLADFAFSYFDGKDMYYNGDLSDLLYLAAITLLSLGICLLDPSKPRVVTSPQLEIATIPNTQEEQPSSQESEPSTSEQKQENPEGQVADNANQEIPSEQPAENYQGQSGDNPNENTPEQPEQKDQQDNIQDQTI